MSSMTFDTKIAVVVRSDLAMWQKLNVTAFTISGIVGTTPDLIGPNYEDANGNLYLPMIIQPILIFEASAEQLRAAYDKAMERGIKLSIYTEDLFSTGNDIDNRAAVKAVAAATLNLVGIAMRDRKKPLDKVLSGIPLHH